MPVACLVSTKVETRHTVKGNTFFPFTLYHVSHITQSKEGTARRKISKNFQIVSYNNTKKSS